MPEISRNELAMVFLVGILASGDSHIDGDTDPIRWSRLAFKYADAFSLVSKEPVSPVKYEPPKSVTHG